MLSLTQFADLAAVLTRWHRATMWRQFDEAEQIAEELIVRCKAVVRGSATAPLPSGEDKNGAVIVGILARGLQGHAEVLKLRSSPNWQGTPEAIEATWQALCDATARLEYAREFLQHPTLDAARRDLSDVRNEIDSLFGPGLYVSPVMVIESFLCSVCGEDHRRCPHMVGRLYDGVCCVKVATRLLRAESVDIVKVPEDPRCRIWPWDRTDEPPGFKEVCLLTSFRLDDFFERSAILQRRLCSARSRQRAVTSRSRRRRKARHV